MDGFEVYKTYLALKLHFSKDNYNFFTFNGKSRASLQSFEKRKDKSWESEFHSVSSTFQKDLLELEEQSIPHIVIGVINQLKHLRHSVLSLVELIWIFLCTSIFLILKQRHDELYKLVNHLGFLQVIFVLDH